MRLALLSDIHANLPALEAVVKSLAAQRCDSVIVAGDSVGYYFWPKEVFSLLNEISAVSVAGNHEVMLTNSRVDSTLLEENVARYGSGLLRCLTDLSSSQLDQIDALPHTLIMETMNGKVLICHGSPTNVDEYIYPDTSLTHLRPYVSDDVRWVVMGHTHYPMDRSEGGVTFINPGSVGQPRNGKPGAHWATLDTETGKIDFFTEQYDTTMVVNWARKLHPELPYLSEILSRI